LLKAAALLTFIVHDSQAMGLIERSQGIQRARQLAEHHCFLASGLVRTNCGIKVYANSSS
jgi:hypothetical protein